jgi:signal transduction histidine kinase
MEQLLAVAGELVTTHSREAIARIIVEHGLEAVGASYGGVWLIDGDELSLLAASQLPRGSIDRWRRVPLALAAPIPDAIRRGAAVFLTLAEYAERYPESFARSRDTVSSEEPAYANLPLLASGKPVGALAVTFERGADLDDTERTFLTILAHQCGEALGRVAAEEAAARAILEEREARRQADEATRAREEILSVVSHDLRNPLGTILMGAATLHQLADPNDPKGQRVRVVAERIQRQSERMARLIEDLVDFAGIQAGKLVITRSANAPEAMLVQAAELFGPLALERGLAFETQIEPGLPDVDCDGDRTLQILSNLIGNAVKVTPKGGRITIGARRVGGEIALFVHDTGPGIDAEELPLMFERYWRSKKPTYKGAGLGLSIAKGIVDAHAGRIWAESVPGAGATFLFTLG